MPTKPRAPRHRRSRAARRPPRPVAPAPAARSGATGIEAPPTGHAVCRGCGRIVRLALSDGDGPNLLAFADRRPEGWSADAVSLTVTGTCPRCREGSTQRA
ncbi:MAG: hypothetical protein L3J81_00260 [Thermoplasmata archaeon]|jgi:hypothetical protein|nr:hypothetical protein [Thermoplasmata archaeon]